MKKQFRLFLVVVILVLAVISFVTADSWLENGPGAAGAQATQAANITATYGAEEYYLQLTAIASPAP